MAQHLIAVIKKNAIKKKIKTSKIAFQKRAACYKQTHFIYKKNATWKSMQF